MTHPGGRPTDYTEEKAYIYVLRDPDTGEVRYVGQTKNQKQRYLQHIGRQYGTNYRANWIRSLKNKGKLPIFEVVEEINHMLWREKEQYWVKKFKRDDCRLVNYDNGGVGACTKEKLSRSHIIKKGLMDAYKSLLRMGSDKAMVAAFKLRWIYKHYPDQSPNSWKNIGLQLEEPILS